jgi:hypothetical protein
MWVYQLDTPSIENCVFRPRPDVRYIIFAQELSADERKFRVEAEEPTAFGIHGSCGEGPRWSLDQVRELDKITSRKRPRK